MNQLIGHPVDHLNPSPGMPPIMELSHNEGVKIERELYSPEREVFVFAYKKGHSIIIVHFQAENLKTAVADAKEVCRVKKWTWIGVTPFLRDIKRMMQEE